MDCSLTARESWKPDSLVSRLADSTNVSAPALLLRVAMLYNDGSDTKVLRVISNCLVPIPEHRCEVLSRGHCALHSCNKYAIIEGTIFKYLSR